MGREPDSLAKGDGRLSRVARLPLCRDDDGLWAARPWEVVAAAAGEDVIISEASRFWRTVDDIQGMELRMALVGGLVAACGLSRLPAGMLGVGGV